MQPGAIRVKPAATHVEPPAAAEVRLSISRLTEVVHGKESLMGVREG